jgi:hypothetical protein
MKRMIVLFVALLTMPQVGFGNSADELRKLHSTPVSLYHFGVFRLAKDLEQWTKEQRDYPGLLSFVSHESNGQVIFLIIGVDRFGSFTSKAEIATACDDIRIRLERFLGNYGNPEEKNADGFAMYFTHWGQYFAALRETGAATEKIGRAIAQDVTLTIRTFDKRLNECKYNLGRPYEK